MEFDESNVSSRCKFYQLLWSSAWDQMRCHRLSLINEIFLPIIFVTDTQDKWLWIMDYAYFNRTLVTFFRETEVLVPIKEWIIGLYHIYKITCLHELYLALSTIYLFLRYYIVGLFRNSIVSGVTVDFNMTTFVLVCIIFWRPFIRTIYMAITILITCILCLFFALQRVSLLSVAVNL